MQLEELTGKSPTIETNKNHIKKITMALPKDVYYKPHIAHNPIKRCTR